jgi:tRNA pseudouridine55 synthase
LYLSSVRHGFLLIDKPTGFTSHDVVAVVRKTLSERSIGHLGTLDPLATGLLVLAVGKKALKVVQLFGELSKTYEATIEFGKVSTTYDADGVLEVVPPRMGWNAPDLPALRQLLKDRFVGKIQQTPPAHSAIHIDGERAYDLARKGIEVVMPVREVQIDAIEVLEYSYPKLRLQVSCGSGTYIRSLAHDLGQVWRCGSYLTGLRRTQVGKWSVENAVTPDSAKWTSVLPLKDVLQSFPRRDLTADEFEDLTHGRNIETEVSGLTIGWHEDLPVVILEPASDGTAHAKRVLN